MADILAGFAGLPEMDVTALLDGRRALILAPHPDDESLGCGGLIAAACDAGLPPVVTILTDGAASHPGSLAFPPPALRALREAEAVQAVMALGLPPANLHFLGFADTQLPREGACFQAAAGRLAEIARSQACRLVIGPWAGDPHCDHEAGAALALEVAGRLECGLLSYPVWGWLRNPADFVAEPRTGGARLNITAQADRKRRAISAHVSQYGGIIEDSPNGFQLPADLLKIFETPFEVFIS